MNEDQSHSEKWVCFMTTETPIGRYTLGQRIGSGGMGDVYRGLDTQTQTAVAIKILKSELATQEMVQRFIREGEALRQLNHPNIVKLLDAIHEDGRYFLVMELVEGGSLDDLLMQTPRLPITKVLNIALDLADALTRAHRLNIIHRDIKPANVLLANDGMLRLTDFGIARVVDSNITETGSLLGTIAYIAPEIFQGKLADARSDIWSMGLMLFEMMAGEHPFLSDSGVGGSIQAILTQSLPDLESLRPDAPTALIDVINRMVLKDPDERIPRMRLVGAELEAILARETAVSTPETRATEFIIRLEVDRRFETPPAAAVEVLRHNLPVQITPFVAREAELDELGKLLREHSVRLLTIVGPGGMGKTRLSLEVAAKFLQHSAAERLFEHGIFFIDLAPVTSAENIIGATAEAVGCIFQQDGRDPARQLFDHLREKNMLLIFDNFEHLMAGRAFVQEVLQTVPSVKILVTSREKLNLNAETVFILSGMSFPNWETPADALEYGAVKLFLQSAHRVRRDFELDADSLTYVARICRMVQGTPLGILLAASWLEVLTPREISEEISSSLDFLETEMHDLPERQRSLRAVFEYSWSLLTEQERMLFARFSRFHGGFTRDAALQITGTNLRALTTLVNKSLLRRDTVSGRYEVHELLRQYAEEKLEQSADRDGAASAYSHYYLDLLVQLTPRLKGFGQLDALNQIDGDFENIRAAWDWAVQQRSADTIGAALEGLYLYLTFRNRWMDGEQMFGAARQVWSSSGDQPSLLAGRLLVRFPQGRPLEQYRLGLAIAQQHADAFEVAFCQRLIGHWLSHTEFDQDAGVPLMEASLRGYQALGNKFYAAQVLDDLGWSHMLMTDLMTQENVVQQSLDLRRELGDKIGISNSLRNMGGSRGGYFDDTNLAFTYWEEAKAIAYEMNDRLLIAWNATLQAANLLFKGEFERAEALIAEGFPHAAHLNHPVVKGLLILERAAIAGLRDENYALMWRLVDEGFPPGAPLDLQVNMVAFSMVIFACGTHDLSVLPPFVNTFLKLTPLYRLEFTLPMFTPCYVLYLTDQGAFEHAAELHHLYANFNPIFMGRPFAMGWTRNWKVLKQLGARIEGELGSAAYQAAQERSKQLDVNQVGQEVLDFLDDFTR
ncbi:MAG: protein kinase [Chloroflexi bacterium]|nr:protein kinase [Chloroflexota bacterium]